MVDRNTISQVIESLFEDWILTNKKTHPLAVENMRLLEADAIALLKEKETGQEMVKLIFDDWSWKCENCNGMMALPGIVASLQMLEEKKWKYCPYCGKKIDFKKTKEGATHQ